MKTGIYDKNGNEICTGDTVAFCDLLSGEVIRGETIIPDEAYDSENVPFCVTDKRPGRDEVKTYPYYPDAEYLICLRKYCKYQTTIEYQFIKEGIYLHSIVSKIPKCGNGTAALKSFLKNFAGYDIWLYSSDELGTSENVLNRWYENMGFIPCSRDSIAEYNVTHIKKSSETK